MKNINYAWHQRFRELYDKALVKYRNEHRNIEAFFTPREVGVLRSFGAKPIELDVENVSEKTLEVETLPAKEAQFGGVVWLPRIIEKAKGRLRGELPNELMYCCGGDRRFFRTHDLHPADFLRYVWAAKGNQDKILAYVKGKR